MSHRKDVRRLLKKMAFEQDQGDRAGRVKMGHVTEGNSAYWSYVRVFIPFYLLRKNTYFPWQVSFYLKSCDHFSFIKKTLFSVKISLQYVAAQPSFILRTMAFLPPVLCEGLWVVGDEKRAPSCHSPTKPLKMMTASISTQCHILKVIFLR